MHAAWYESRSWDSADPADAYGMALLDLLQQPEVLSALMLGEV